MRTLDLARDHGPHLIDVRRRLHRIPEIGLRLPKTQALLLEEIRALGGDLEVSTGEGLDSVVVVLRGRGGRHAGIHRPVVLLRGDMDALPVTEEVDVDYASEHPGAMHACGHDLHMAVLLGALRILLTMRETLEGDVVFMFQPGEEGPGGAEPMIAEGLLDVAGRRVDAAYALHVFSAAYPRGVFFGRPGTLMAGCDEVYVRVVGEGGHGSAPEKCKDPIPVACEMVGALQAMVTRRFSIWDPVVVTVGKIAGGTKENIIPDDCEWEATVRTFSDEARSLARQAIPQLAHDIATAHGLTAEVRWVPGYPPTVNEPGEWARVERCVAEMFGAERLAIMPDPEAGGEDFSYVADLVPSAYVDLSACAAQDHLAAPDNHSPRAAFDDSVVPDGAALLAELALRRCADLARDAEPAS